MAESLFDRVETGGGTAVLRTGPITVQEVIERLEAGEAPAQVAEALGISAADLIAALAFDALGPTDDDGPPLVQAQPKRPRLASALSEAALARLLPHASHPARLALVAGLCQIYDFWDASHEAAQQAGDLGERAAASYWHGIAHRREPDPDNAAYWFRRVGRHEAFGTLASAAGPLLESFGDASLAARLAPPGRLWDPFAMIDFCSSARRGSRQEALAKRLQRLEMRILIDHTAAPAGL